VIFGLASWPIAHEILAWMSDLGIAVISQAQLRNTAKLMAGWERVSPIITILSIAVITPIGEEIAFRGYLFAAFQSKNKPWRVVFISAALFASFHVVSPGVLSFERFAPSFFLGLILGYVRYKSGSIWPSIAIHMIHNGLLQLFLANREYLEKMGLDNNAENLHLPIAWQLGSIAAVAIALGLVWGSRRASDDPIALKA
jgi:sodium transport system permease protein